MLIIEQFKTPNSIGYILALINNWKKITKLLSNHLAVLETDISGLDLQNTNKISAELEFRVERWQRHQS